MSSQIMSIYRYPVKGLSAESLDRIKLAPGEGLPDDRRFALARPETRFDPSRPEWLPKSKFVMLARDESLAQLRTRFDGQSGRLSIEREGHFLLSASLLDPNDRRRAEGFFGDFLGDALTGPPRVVTAAGHMFTDASRKPNSTTYKYVSLINMASIRALQEVVKVPIDPIRFRANIVIDGPPAWSELDWVGSEMIVGGARLRVISPTVRCAATTVNPTTAERDLDVPGALRTAFGHIHMGVYAEVATGGEIGPGDAVRPITGASVLDQYTRPFWTGQIVFGAAPRVGRRSLSGAT